MKFVLKYESKTSKTSLKAGKQASNEGIDLQYMRLSFSMYNTYSEALIVHLDIQE